MNKPNGKFWLVWNPARSAPLMKHPSQESARVEAERLARINPGQQFWVLEARGYMRTIDPCAWAEAV